MSAATGWNAASTVARDFADQWKQDEPGGAIIGFDGSGIRFAHAGGVESLSTLVPFTADSVVRYASVTKHAFAAMVLKHADLIGLDDRLGDHLPELQAPIADVTVGQALDMSGGLPDTRECLTLLGLSVYTETTAEQLLAFLASMTRLNFDAGTQVSYSNTGYRLIEAILERKGHRFDDFIQTDIATPLGIVLKAPDVWNDTVRGLVPGYWKTPDKWQLSAAGLHISASGSLTGSGHALATWAQALVCGRDGFESLLSTLSAPRRMADGRMSGYGLGLRWSTLGNRRFVGHGGSHPGYKSYFLLDPAEKTGFVVVSNREDTNGYKIALNAMAALTGEALPRTDCSIPDGLFASTTGACWLEMSNGVANYLDSEDTLYDDGDGWFSSRSASSPIYIRWTGAALEGQIGHAERRLVPVAVRPAGTELDGRWEANLYGAHLDVRNGHVIMGIGPTRQFMPLEDLGNGRCLFTLHDGPWKKRICLHRLNDDRFELVLSRSRMIEYTRVR